MTTCDRENREDDFGHFQNLNCDRLDLAILRERLSGTLPSYDLKGFLLVGSCNLHADTLYYM